MAILQRLLSYLDSHKLAYKMMNHPTAYTAHDVAEMLHVSGNMVAKVVMVKADERMLMVVLPANWKVDIKRVKDVLRAQDVRLASEYEFAQLFPDCDIGSMPPFGNLYGIEVYVDELLTRDEEILFEAGTHASAIKLRYKDFAELVHPKVAEFHREPAKHEF